MEYVLGNYEETPEGEVRKDLDATFAKWENAKRVERCNRGKKRKAESGSFVSGRSPYGYRINKDRPGGLEPIESEAEVVTRVFQLYVMDGHSLNQIARILCDEGTTPQLGGPKWGTSSLRRMLQNTVYIGHFHYNKHKRVGKQLIERDPNEWIRVEIAPIIDEWLFKEAQNKLDEIGPHLGSNHPASIC